MASSPANRVALVIGSGAIKCAAALGLWQALNREKIPLGMTVGASGGSLYAAAIALGLSEEATRAMTLEFWTSDLVEGYTTHLRQAQAGELPFSELSGLVDDGPVMERLERAFGDKTFADTRLPFYAVATDLYSGEPVVISSGRIVDAVRASIAIPLVFAPWKIGERLLVDGAVSNPLPADVAIREGAGLIITLGFDVPGRKRMRSYSAVTAHFNNLYMNNILKATYAFYNAVHHAEIIPILPDFDVAIGGFDAHRIPYIIERGAQAAEAHLPYLRQLLSLSTPHHAEEAE
ncbi:MAG: patatin-like phospholipase family protein [Anaerolineales bacterium]|nr:patatin-like phospholipase family protein [Anaerolineales bacterium]